MKGEFGSFVWNCYKDSQPESNLFVYVYFDSEHGVDVGLAGDYDWNDNMYWCYVYIPDAPVIEKEMTLEERIDTIETMLKNRCSNDYALELEKRIDKLERLI